MVRTEIKLPKFNPPPLISLLQSLNEWGKIFLDCLQLYPLCNKYSLNIDKLHFTLFVNLTVLLLKYAKL